MSYVAGKRDDGAAPAREKRAIRLDILGRRFTVRSDDDDAYIGELVAFLNQKLTDIRRATGSVDTEQVALLTALDLADSLLRERRDKRAVHRNVRDQARQLLDAIQEMTTALRAETEPESHGSLEATPDGIAGGPMDANRPAVALASAQALAPERVREISLETPARPGRRATGL